MQVRVQRPAIFVGLLILNLMLAVLGFLLPGRAEALPLVRSCELFDVIVVGSEPEGIAAAVAAAESGSRTLLITSDDRVGGLFTLGQMNVLDLRTQPFDYQLGFFDRWWQLVGRRHSFDVERAGHAFDTLLHEADVNVVLDTAKLMPIFADARVTGVSTGETAHFARQFIDATAEMDFAAAAGASYSVGFESLGLNERMVDTLVFRIAGVDWQALRQGIRARGPGYAAEDDWVAWGHFGRYPAAYEPEESGLRLRGLNLGRQEDGTLLVNALLVYGVDPFDAESVADGLDRATREAPRIIRYLSRDVPGFENAEFAGVASRLYVRESRHLHAECLLTIDDVLDNRVTPIDVAAGGYPLDVQTLTSDDDGFVYGAPDIYGIRLCSAVPVGLQAVWVVGKAAGFDPLAASSARVVPFGMAFGEAVGIAAALAVKDGLDPVELVNDAQRIAAVRSELLERGAFLPEVKPRDPVGPYQHPAYAAYRLLLNRGLAVGGYDNDPRLDEPVAALSYVYLLSNVATRFLNDHATAQQLAARFTGLNEPLTSRIAAEITSEATYILHGFLPESVEILEVLGDLGAELDGLDSLTRGQMYQLAARFLLEIRDAV